MRLLAATLSSLALAAGVYAQAPDSPPASAAPGSPTGTALRIAIDGLAGVAIREPAVAAYLGTGETGGALDESRVICSADLNGDAVSDNLIALRRANSVVLAAYLNGGADGVPSFAGAIRIDAAELPVAKAEDVTGNGQPEVRLTFSRPGLAKSEIRSLAFAGLVNGKLTELFRCVLDQVERSGVDHRRSTQIVRVIGNKDGGASLIQVDSRIAELVGKDGEEREIAASVISGTTVYQFTGARYSVLTSEIRLPSEEQLLAAAAELMDAGALERAMIVAEGLRMTEGTSGNVTIMRRADALADKIREAAAEAEVAALPAPDRS